MNQQESQSHVRHVLAARGGVGPRTPRVPQGTDSRRKEFMTRRKQAVASRDRAAVLSYDQVASSDRGASLAMSLSRGATSGSADALWQRTTMTVFVDNGEAAHGRTLEAEFGYSFRVLDGRAVGTPCARVSRSVIGETPRLGYSLGFGQSSELSIEVRFRGNPYALWAGYRYRVGFLLERELEGFGARRRTTDAPGHGMELRLTAAPTGRRSETTGTIVNRRSS